MSGLSGDWNEKIICTGVSACICVSRAAAYVVELDDVGDDIAGACLEARVGNVLGAEADAVPVRSCARDM